MTAEEREFLKRINDYANQINNKMDPSKVQLGSDLDKLKPIMEEIAKEQHISLEDVFIRYMDLSTQLSAKKERVSRNVMDGMENFPF